MDGLESEGYEDGRLCQGSCWASPSTQRTDSGLMATKKNDYSEGCVRKNINPSTQLTDFGLKVMKTYDNIESHARGKEDSWEATDDSTEDYNQEGISARSGQTPI